MSGIYQALARPLIFNLDAERAHGASIKALRAGLHPKYRADTDPRLATDIAGLSLPNPLGMAAGYDKNADVPEALLSMGYGHVEVGTVTPVPQPGNDKPRIFRLVRDDAVINRLGFNSRGHDVVKARMLRLARNTPGLVGVNIGANKKSADFAADYVIGIKSFASLADYLTINISSPNTPGLRDLQQSNALRDLLKRVDDARGAAEQVCPVFLKVAPDLDEAAMDAIADAVNDSHCDGLIVSNTTLSREGLLSSNKDEAGGLSGKPLFHRSTVVLARMRQRIRPDLPLIGVGGVHDAKSALHKIEAGADLVQLYTGMIYRGPSLPGDILTGLSRLLDAEGLSSISQAKGRAVDRWAGLDIDG
ncbi:MAG: quinone-dependent dihydroorotate dehydrogenase [Ahrensia sp.]|nr:quinone-dependent dihydroorotate dehydrogenase [Ahrensia sp.]